MNRLAHETSPYLLQHADNPVDWWPWSAEAFDEARKTNRPVLGGGFARYSVDREWVVPQFEKVNI